LTSLGFGEGFGGAVAFLSPASFLASFSFLANSAAALAALNNLCFFEALVSGRYLWSNLKSA